MHLAVSATEARFSLTKCPRDPSDSFSLHVRHFRMCRTLAIVSSRAPTVDRPTGSRYIYLTFEGLRDSRTIADKQTRIRVALPASEVAHRRELLTEPAEGGTTCRVVI